MESIFIDNWEIDADWDWTYDPAYRLTAATGRERDMPTGDPAPGWVTADQFFPGAAASSAQRNYTEYFAYDGVGNFTSWQHVVAGDSSASWTRTYAYEMASTASDAAQISNRLVNDAIGGVFDSVGYLYDNAGNMTRMPHLPGTTGVAGMQWDWANRLRQTYASNSAVTRYTYDSAGERVRKVFGTLSGGTFTATKETVVEGVRYCPVSCRLCRDQTPRVDTPRGSAGQSQRHESRVTAR